MKIKNILVSVVLSVLCSLSYVAHAGVEEDYDERVAEALASIPLGSEGAISTLRYPALSKTGNYILAWPSDHIYYESRENTNYSNHAELLELQADGSWKIISRVIRNKEPGVYQYRLLRILEEEEHSVDSGGEDDDSISYDTSFEKAIEVIVVGDSQ